MDTMDMITEYFRLNYSMDQLIIIIMMLLSVIIFISVPSIIVLLLNKWHHAKRYKKLNIIANKLRKDKKFLELFIKAVDVNGPLKSIIPFVGELKLSDDLEPKVFVDLIQTLIKGIEETPIQPPAWKKEKGEGAVKEKIE